MAGYRLRTDGRMDGRIERRVSWNIILDTEILLYDKIFTIKLACYSKSFVQYILLWPSLAFTTASSLSEAELQHLQNIAWSLMQAFNNENYSISFKFKYVSYRHYIKVLRKNHEASMTGFYAMVFFVQTKMVPFPKLPIITRVYYYKLLLWITCEDYNL